MSKPHWHMLYPKKLQRLGLCDGLITPKGKAELKKVNMLTYTLIDTIIYDDMSKE